jgi:hypothetical protein
MLKLIIIVVVVVLFELFFSCFLVSNATHAHSIYADTKLNLKLTPTLYVALYYSILNHHQAYGIFVLLIIINDEMADVVQCEHQKMVFFCYDVTMREDVLSGTTTMPQERP